MNSGRLRSVDTAEVRDKRVLVRADLNVPVRDGRVADDTRLRRICDGLARLADRGAKVIVISHFGRPAGRDEALTLRPVAQQLAQLLGRPVKFSPDAIGAAAVETVASMAPGDVAVLENVRFHSGEEDNDPQFARALAANGDIYVGDAFSCAHRAHASTTGVARLLPAYAGPSMLEEITALRRALETPERPTVAIVGGAKVSTKIPILINLIAKVDALVIGGGMANTFLRAGGTRVGRSLSEPDFCGTAQEVIEKARSAGCRIILPTDVVVAPRLENGAPSMVVDVAAVPEDQMILDVGLRSVEHMSEILAASRTLLWNGPLGAFEVEPFGRGTFALARFAADRTRQGRLVSVAGGGDTAAALNAAGVATDFTYVSTAGGAFLEWLEGRELPGVAALMTG